ncbi:Hpt domain-containing protein [Aquimarina brevivitae]|uniref:HPt (Histidine-containing phosphotransfer) domain-containing protein n=1 Tax=Aquimarina brevivitae TaxID=323412 RepID=A0A4V2F7M0_9FLAO|nr:Hpt domain-containing protein [Aquimarina brevivitae]RZT00290.1 HPt (histidine-containing phosphotransfer) domain-containing protein [Aquimarina brevivitae]
MDKAYNLEAVNELSGGDEEFIAVLVQTFLEEIPPDLDGMVKAVNEGDAATAYQYAHKMKPNLQLFNIDLLTEIKRVESWSKSKKSKEEIQPTVNHIVTTVTKAIGDLKKDFS